MELVWQPFSVPDGFIYLYTKRPPEALSKYILEKENIGIITNPRYLYANEFIRVKLTTHLKVWEDVLLPGINAVAPVISWKSEDIPDGRIIIKFSVEY